MCMRACLGVCMMCVLSEYMCVLSVYMCVLTHTYVCFMCMHTCVKVFRCIDLPKVLSGHLNITMYLSL